jgi:glutamate-1-semialdehyde 2,1-aminomutase
MSGVKEMKGAGMGEAGPRSRAAFDRAKQNIPGGVNSPARAFGGVGGSPLFIERADGAYLWDVDGRSYVDYIGSWGPMILGHARAEVIEAIGRAAVKGTSYGAPTEAESQLAEQIIDAVPSIEMVRLVSSGTEATMSAIRVARGFTGRAKVIKFAGNYHGHVDSLLVAAGSSAATLGVPDSPGVTAGATQDTIVLQYHDLAAIDKAFAAHPGEIAAVILEPVVGNMGCIVPTMDYLQGLRQRCTTDGTVLIFDEVMTGFRLAYGGVQARLGITPDMTTLGKIVGGGLPLGAYGGKREIMQCVLPAGKVFQAGTLSGNPLAVAAGSTTLRLLKEESPYQRLDQLGAMLAKGLNDAADRAGIPACVQQIGSMMTLFFTPGPVIDWPTASQSNRTRFAKYFWGMIGEGIYMPCSQFEALFFSVMHDERVIQRTIDAAGRVLRELDR